ncbi:MAG: hypothetical protein KGY68_04075 [Candidatus Thermoplasmatota archaeon]|nr:hypothetical protein [Candidatus Thermoplasmatota archaeon]
MKEKIFVFAVTFSLLLGGMLVAVGDEAIYGDEVETKENGAFFEVEITECPEEVELGEVIEIKVFISNSGDEVGTQDIIYTVKAERVDFEEKDRIEDVTIYPGLDEERTIEYDTGHLEEEYGQDILEIEVEVEITVESENDSDTETFTIISPGLIPGFTSLLLLVALITAVAIYRKKSTKQ